MKKKDVQRGAVYTAKVSNKLTKVRVIGGDPYDSRYFKGRNLETGREVRFTAAKLRELVSPPREKKTPARKGKSPLPPEYVFHKDFHGYTCIEVSRNERAVRYIPLNARGLKLEHEPIDSFDRRFTPVVNHPAERAAATYVRAASKHLGADPEVMKYLGRITAVTEEQREAAVKRVRGEFAQEPGAKRTGRGGPRGGAAEMFRGLIMEGKLTDQEIVEQVREKFGGNKTAKDVAYYRWDLRQKGVEVPPRVKPKESKDMATRKQKKKTASKKGTTTKKSDAGKKKAGAGKKQTGPKDFNAKPQNSSQMFEQLIMQGQLTDDEIFERVQKQYGLPDTSRRHVGWYRWRLKRDGYNPPGAVRKNGQAGKAQAAPSKKKTTKKTGGTKKKTAKKAGKKKASKKTGSKKASRK